MTRLRRAVTPVPVLRTVPWSETLTSAAPATDTFDGHHVLSMLTNERRDVYSEVEKINK